MVFDQMQLNDHEQVVFCHDKEIGLKAIIAIHNTQLGPGLGGTRVLDYHSEAEAIEDVLRLSRGMTFKNALAGLNFGGGKAVILGDPEKVRTEPRLRRFGRFIHGLAGRYVTTEDMNMRPEDMERIKMETPFVTGLDEGIGGSGSPGPVTAYGVFVGMQAAANKKFGSDSLAGKKVLVQGLGSVGTTLLHYLNDAGADILVSDIDEQKIIAVAQNYKVTVVAPKDVFDADCDIYAPCARGATLHDDSIPRLKCTIIAGAANNQLADESRNDKQLFDRGILYVPDFLVNAGGVINVGLEYMGQFARENVMTKTSQIYDRSLALLKRVEATQVPPQQAATEMAMERIEDIGKVKRYM